jgi:beta-N-acetylhexosaminidase
MMQHIPNGHRFASMPALAALALLLVACSSGTSSGALGHAIAVPTQTTVPSGAPTSSTVGTSLAASLRAPYLQSADWYLSRMSLDEKLGQMFLIETVWQGYNQDVDNMVSGMHAGAMIVYQQNMASYGQLHDYIATIQAHASIPLMVTMDEEGGGVDRLGYTGFDPPQPAALDVAQSGNPNVARQEGATLAHEMRAMGINVDLAPVVDVLTTSSPAELYTRLYGTTPSVVEKYAGAFLQGLQQNGIPGTLKHWPGIGSTTQDPHLTLPTITHSKAELQSTDFATFKALLADDPAMIMVTHVIVPAYDPNYPATFSPTLVNGVLRGQLGYDGVVMTDSLYMGGIKDFLHDNNLYTELPKAAVLSIQAGDDLLEGAFDTPSMSAMIAGIKAAMRDGRISQSRIDQSVHRILALKVQYGMLPLHVTAKTAATGQGTNAAGAVQAAVVDADVPRAMAA